MLWLQQLFSSLPLLTVTLRALVLSGVSSDLCLFQSTVTRSAWCPCTLAQSPQVGCEPDQSAIW